MLGASHLLPIVLAFLFCAVALLSIGAIPKIPGLSSLRPPVEKGRLVGLDGLRGFLALGVVLSHAASYREYFRGCAWAEPPSRHLAIAGSFAVSLFFGITGYLFWARAIKGPIDARELYARRFRRVYPLYLAVVVATLAYALLRSPGTLDLHASSLGLLVPGFGQNEPLNGLRPLFAIGQAWTLRYEIAFYLALPLLAPLARTRYGTWLLVAPVCAVTFVPRVLWKLGPELTMALSWACAAFGVGMVAAVLSKQAPVARLLGGPFGSSIVAASIVARFALLPTGYPPLGALATLGVLLPLVCGADLFGLLSRRVCRELGEITYSVYMVHNLALFAVLSAIGAGRLSDAAYWAIVLATLVLIVATSLVTFRLFEWPFFARRPVANVDAAASRPAAPPIRAVVRLETTAGAQAPQGSEAGSALVP